MRNFGQCQLGFGHTSPCAFVDYSMWGGYSQRSILTIDTQHCQKMIDKLSSQPAQYFEIDEQLKNIERNPYKPPIILEKPIVEAHIKMEYK